MLAYLGTNPYSSACQGIILDGVESLVFRGLFDLEWSGDIVLGVGDGGGGYLFDL